jgi:hypothetical protein
MRIVPSSFAFGLPLLVLLGLACGSSDGSVFDESGSRAVPDGGSDVTPPEFEDGGAPANADDFKACATAEGEAQRQPAYVLVALDGSGSMAQLPNGLPSNKWQAAKDALDAAFDSFGTRADPTFGVGFTIFCDVMDASCRDDVNNSSISYAGPYDYANVPIRVVDAAQKDALRQRIDNTQPNFGTPTYEVLAGQLALLENFVPAPPLKPGGRKVLIFISDGVPDEDMPKGRENMGDTDGEAKASKAIVAEKSSAVTTFSVGVGELLPLVPAIYDPRFMADLALAGGAAKPGCSRDEVIDESKMCHFQITPGGKNVQMLAAEFERALDSIRTSVLSCDYPLEISTGGDALDPSRVNVVFTDGAGQKSVIGQSAADGWSFDNPASPTRVRLNGASCDRAKADLSGKVSVVLGCKTVLR